MIERLPLETIVKILQYLTINDICSLSITCRQLNYACEDNSTWHHRACLDLLWREQCLLYIRDLPRIGINCGWKACYRLLYMLNNKQPGFFWDDADELAKQEYSPDRQKTLSVLMKDLVCKILKLDHIETWTVNAKMLEAITIVLTTEPQIPTSIIIETMLDIGEGPHQTGSLDCLKIKTSTCAIFANIKQESYHCESIRNSRISQYQLDQDYKKILEELQKSQVKTSYRQVFRTTKQSVQNAVLRIIITILKHCNLDNVERKNIHVKLQKSFNRKSWLQPTQGLRNWILHLITKSKTIMESDVLPIDYFNPSVKPEVVALQMMYKEQVKLSKKYLNNYINEIVFPSVDNELQNYFNIYDPDEDMKKKRGGSLASMMVTIFSNMPDEEHKSKISRVCRLVKIAEWLEKLHNYASFKDLLGAIRGVLTFKSKTGLSWNDIGYYTLKTFVGLEEIISADNNYQAYRNTIRKLKQHSLPIISTHLKEIDKLRVEYNEADHIPVKKLQEYLYFDSLVHRKQAVAISKMYHHFTGL